MKLGKRPAPKKLRVLIADDSSAIRDSLAALISRMRKVEIVGFAQTGREALEKIRLLKPDVVTLDIRMPELNGINVLEAVQRDGLQVIVIVLTGFAEEEYRKRCLDLGARHYFQKATEFESVIEVLDKYAGRLAAPSGNTLLLV